MREHQTGAEALDRLAGIDLNKDGLLQYDEFKKMAQITESHILFESE